MKRLYEFLSELTSISQSPPRVSLFASPPRKPRPETAADKHAKSPSAARKIISPSSSAAKGSLLKSPSSAAKPKASLAPKSPPGIKLKPLPRMTAKERSAHAAHLLEQFLSGAVAVVAAETLDEVRAAAQAAKAAAAASAAAAAEAERLKLLAAAGGKPEECVIL